MRPKRSEREKCRLARDDAHEQSGHKAASSFGQCRSHYMNISALWEVTRPAPGHAMRAPTSPMIAEQSEKMRTAAAHANTGSISGIYSRQQVESRGRRSTAWLSAEPFYHDAASPRSMTTPRRRPARDVYVTRRIKSRRRRYARYGEGVEPNTIARRARLSQMSKRRARDILRRWGRYYVIRAAGRESPSSPLARPRPPRRVIAAMTWGRPGMPSTTRDALQMPKVLENAQQAAARQ